MGCLARFTSRRSPTAGRLDTQVFVTLYGTLRMQSRGPASEDAPTLLPTWNPQAIGASLPGVAPPSRRPPERERAGQPFTQRFPRPALAAGTVALRTRRPHLMLCVSSEQQYRGGRAANLFAGGLLALDFWQAIRYAILIGSNKPQKKQLFLVKMHLFGI